MSLLRRRTTKTPWAEALAEARSEQQRAKALAARAEVAAAAARRRTNRNHLTEAIVDFVTKGKHA